MKVDNVIILTHKEKDEVKLPHLKWLQRSNPNVNIHIVVGEETGLGKHYHWKNGDIPLRKWWQENSHLVVGNGAIAVIEWDTVVFSEFPELPDECDLVGKWCFKKTVDNNEKHIQKRMLDKDWHQDFWYWWMEIPKLEFENEEIAVGLVSFGCFIMKRWVLDAVASPKWDKLYKVSIQNELRFPSIAHKEGANVGQIDLPNVSWTVVTLGERKGIYHAIKEIIPDEDNI